MRHSTTRRALGLIAACVALLLPVASARADTVTDPNLNAAIEWNAIATTAAAIQPPHVVPLSLAMVQGAVYDAVNAIDGGHQPYLVSSPANPADSKEAALATAAFRVLVGFPDLPGLFPGQLSTLQPLYDASLAGVPEGAAKTGGIAVGEAAAMFVIAKRRALLTVSSFSLSASARYTRFQMSGPLSCQKIAAVV